MTSGLTRLHCILSSLSEAWKYYWAFVFYEHVLCCYGKGGNIHIVLNSAIFSITLEPSLFVGDQCSWILWITFTHEFSCSQTYFYFFINLYKHYPITLFISYPPNQVSEPAEFWLPTNINPHKLK
jgi:hypothetical protein